MTSASTYFRGFLEGLHDPLVLLVGGLQLELQLLDLDAGGPFLHSDKEQFEGEFTFFLSWVMEECRDERRSQSEYNPNVK